VTANAMPVSTAEHCKHRGVPSDNKCYEGCADIRFKDKALPIVNGCLKKWGWTIVDSTSVVEQCNDGVTNLKYCSGGNLEPVNITMKVWSKNKADALQDPMGDFCRHRGDLKDNKCYQGCAATRFKDKGLPLGTPCNPLWSVLDSTTMVEQCNDGITNIKYCSGGNLEPVNITMKVLAKAKAGGDTSETADTPDTEPCCQGKCQTEGEEKYWSIASGILGGKHCGECCMDPSKYNLFHFFEKNLTKSESDSPCKGFGYTKYDSTVTHGFGPVSMTLDLYDLP